MALGRVRTGSDGTLGHDDHRFGIPRWHVAATNLTSSLEAPHRRALVRILISLQALSPNDAKARRNLPAQYLLLSDCWFFRSGASADERPVCRDYSFGLARASGAWSQA